MTIEERLEQLEKEIKRYKVVASYVPYGGSGSGGSIDAYTKEEVDEMIESVSGDLDDKMDKVNPTGTGSFSLNRRSDTTTGTNSFSAGNNCTASGANAHAEGNTTTASGANAHAEGNTTTASGANAHAEGYRCESQGENGSHAEGYQCKANGNGAHAEGVNCSAIGPSVHAEGSGCTAVSASYPCHVEGYRCTIDQGYRSHVEGNQCISRVLDAHVQGVGCVGNRTGQFVFGRYNEYETFIDASTGGIYAEIAGNGSNDQARSNARTLDWDGNEWLQGYLTASSIRLRSTTSGSTKIFEITVDDNGTLTVTEVI